MPSSDKEKEEDDDEEDFDNYFEEYKNKQSIETSQVCNLLIEKVSNLEEK